MKKTELLINPNEAVLLAGWRPLDDLEIVATLEEEIDRAMFTEQDLHLFHKLKLLAIWNAGRIQGIREERIKRTRGFAPNRAPIENKLR